ncbi:dual oxidase 2 short isoform [Salpingoeca rosetta]|uniref:Dual oxidase 2 short isoform n=1 Tax=Salpingoeca rosetta (strain ATCC 50818 / BSB-021) TaxID=946362 RepID=F2UDN5_SALR5|nr:dual oxidase 2 short isoform [Salpingoeca rosetta]EGD74730.1 dual oxidase 2 short isoform [Salpingoeca rosetta]|eukprot:XP_004992987.1 dual oxidase 2 short isoform [Salpingoeca rosetta]
MGVTPYASILQDLPWRYHNNQNVSLRHIHFIWVTRTQKEYEWMVELIREVQAEIPDDVLTVDVYITQGKRDYDLRTSLMFMFERNHIEGSKLISLSRSHHDLNVQEALLLPSGVLCLQMDKPPGFEAMQSGQWLRLKCTAVSKYEWHPFTISSAPQENFVSVHIRSAGPWTTKLRQVFAEAKSTGADLPTVQLEGPFGEIHQDWLNSSVAVFVGGGIGVTPYASILQDLAWRYHNNQNVSLRHIHFIWVTRTQKEYEWMVELIREVQAEIPDDVLTVDVYITQGKRDYDLRTSLMFMFERNHIEGSKVSLLTGLRATTNFQRPNFEKILPALRDQFDPLPISIYTCGPPALANAVENGTRSTNESEATSVPLRHHFVSF